jgi:hypothetical protein
MVDLGKVAIAGLLLVGSFASGAAAQAPSAAAMRPVHLARSNSPGLGQSSWQLLTFDKSAAYYFTSGRLSRNGDAAFGWFTEVFPKPQDFSTAGATGVQFQQSLIWATCSDNYYAIREFAWYDAQGRLFPQSAYMVSVPDFELPKAGSLQESVVKVLCGSFQGQGSLSGDGKFLLADYQKRLAHPETGTTTTVASNDTAKPTAIKARAPLTAPGAIKPPGLASATWNLVNVGDGEVEYYTKKGITRTGATARGWVTEVFSVPQTMDGLSVTFMQTLVEANCTKKTTRGLQLATFDENQEMLSDAPVTNDPAETAEAGSLSDYEMKDLCGVKTGADPEPIVGDGAHLLELTNELLKGPSASNSSAKPTAIKARAPQTAAGALKAPPGLGKASWYMVNLQGDMAEFYTTRGITRTGTTAKGWITAVHTVPETMGSDSVSFVQELIEANCTNKTTKVVQAATFDENQQMLKNIPMTLAASKAPPGSMIDYELKDLCGIKTDLTGSKPMVGDGADLLEFTKILIKDRGQ